MIEQSVKTAMEAYVFEPNDSSTWLKAKTSIDNFLTTLWKGGTLVGASPTEAFETNVGLGVTMTPNDILDGIMRISVKVAISRPAEFIVITFQQKMQES
jgi:phage tail sheath protein FI